MFSQYASYIYSSYAITALILLSLFAIAKYNKHRIIKKLKRKTSAHSKTL